MPLAVRHAYSVAVSARGRHAGSVLTGGLSFSRDVALASWVRPRLTGAWGTVTGVVPSGFPAYARVFHPVQVGASEWLSWAEVASATGRTVHPLMQWQAIIRSVGEGSVWHRGEPAVGDIPVHVLRALCTILAASTRSSDDCVFCLWDGYGLLHGSPAVAIVSSSGDSPDVPPGVGDDVLDGPRVRLPGRDYLLLTGPLAAAGDLDWNLMPDLVDCQSPNLFWPTDLAWCVATEIDYDSTLVGGSTELIDAIVEAKTLESCRVQPADSLMIDADTVNT